MCPATLKAKANPRFQYPLCVLEITGILRKSASLTKKIVSDKHLAEDGEDDVVAEREPCVRQPHHPAIMRERERERVCEGESVSGNPTTLPS